MNNSRTLVILFLFTTVHLAAQSFSPFTLNISDQTKIKPFGESVLDGDSKVDTICKNFTWIPAKTSSQARKLWKAKDTLDLLKGTVINSSSESGAIVADLITDFLGPARVSLSTSVSSVDTAILNNLDVEKFISSGGTAIINTYLVGPTIFWNEGKSTISLVLNPKLNFDFPTLVNSKDVQSMNGDLGCELKMNIPLAEGKLGIVGNYRVGSVFGPNQFYESLNLEKNAWFTYSQLSFGFTIPNINAAFLYTGLIHGPDSFRDSSTGNGRISLLFLGL